MFRNRQSSQKPSDELFERFRQSFPDVRANTSSAPEEQSGVAVAGDLQDISLNQPRFTQEHLDLDPTPRALAEPFRFTPSLTPSAFMDPTSSAFAAFANQPAGLFTPTPGATTTGMNGDSSIALPPTTQQDLHHSNIGISLGTPLSMGGSTTLPPAISSDIQGYGAPHQFQSYQFGGSMHSQYLDPSQYDLRGPSGPGSPMDLGGHDLDHKHTFGDLGMPTTMPSEDKNFGQLSRLDLPPSSERFRFSVVLNAPTAMVKHPDEIPVTYLNKGQAYAVSVVDTAPPPRDASAGPLVYRTFIRISFHDETQRNRPAGCWQLWKEGRGTNEAHHRGGKLQAVEYVEVATGGDEDKKRPKVDLESSSFDGFSVTWSPPPNGPAEAAVSVRFNFLSTDFSHSKGVKGIPVRLCAKTEIIPNGSPRSTADAMEVCYCKVKLFRDHGAERKLANDILHVKKTIDKLKQQAGQSDVGLKLYGKKTKKEEEMSKPGKVQKHKRTWSVSSASSIGGTKTQEEDINAKLQSMQDMFTSTRPVSVLYLRGDEQDDPDMHPVRLPGEQTNGGDHWIRRDSIATTGTNSSFVSPTPSSRSPSQRGDSFSPEKDWDGRGYHHRSGPSQDVPMHVKTNPEDGMLSGWIEAIGIDTSYKPPAEKSTKAVMVVYILPVVPGQPDAPYHRAVYLESRTAACLTNNIASKCGIDPATVYQISHANSKGLSIFVDDDFVSQMNEGQDMKVQVSEILEESPFSSPPPNEWANGNSSQSDGSGPKKLELKLLF